MKNSVKNCLSVGAALVLVGALLFAGAMTACGWDFSLLDTQRYETNTHTVTGDIQSISLYTDTADILLVPSTDGRCVLECYEPEDRKHEVTVEDGALILRAVEERIWYRNMGIHTRDPKITVYLPDTVYGRLHIESDTGDVEIPAGFSFTDISVTTATGDILLQSSASGDISLRAGTGSIRAETLSADNLSVKVSTGRVTLSEVICPGDISLRVSTGRASLTDTRCGSFRTEGSTGDITLKNVIATESFHIVRTTGDVCLDCCDAGEITVKTSTGDVSGTLLTEKNITAHTATGKMELPQTGIGGPCHITTSTGSIRLGIV